MLPIGRFTLDFNSVNNYNPCFVIYCVKDAIVAPLMRYPSFSVSFLDPYGLGLAARERIALSMEVRYLVGIPSASLQAFFSNMIL
jgi:hypothetical protein